jgi:hypothetical protein
MAISNLVSGGQSFERPGVSAFFGKSMTGSNDNVEKVSSNFLSNDMFKTIGRAFDGIGKELSRIQDISKNIMKSFDALIKSTRELNRDITRRFRDVNEQLNKSKIDFLRSIMATPVPASSTPTTIGSLVDKAQSAEQVQPQPPEEKKSFLDSMLDLASLAETAKDAFDVAKKYGPRLMQGARAFAGSAALPITAVAGGMIALGYHRKQAQEADPLGAENFDRSISSGAKRAEVIQGPEADKNAPNAGADISRQKLSPPDFLMREGIIKMPSEAKNVIASIKGNIITLKDGRYFDNTEQILRNADGTPVGKQTVNAGDGTPTPSAGPAYRYPGFKDLNESRSTSGGPSKVTSGEDLDEDQIKNKRIAGLAIKYGLTPSTVTATLEGGVPTSLTSNGITVDVYNDLTPEEKEKVNTARKMRSEMRGDAKKNEAPQAPGANPPAGNAAGDNAGAGGPTGAAGANAPAAAATAPPANNVAGASEGDQGAPEKAPAAPGGGAGGAGATGAESAPAGAPTPAPPAASSGSSEGGAAGGSTGAPEAAPAAAPSPGGGAGAPAAEGMGTSGSPDGAPAAPSAAPTTPPPPPPTPEAPAGGGDPIVMNNSSTQSIGKAAAGETSVMSGQNLPMSAQNEKIQEYLARQTVNYQ